MPTSMRLRPRRKVENAETTSSGLPELPIEIYGCIAEFLAGSHAFGSLAWLNVVSHAIRNETLPVLYETVFYDKVGEMGHSSVVDWLFKEKPERYQHTKFVILARRRRVGGMVDLNYAITSNKHASLPNLAMILTAGTGQQYVPYGCRIYLFKPLRPSTVFGVIANTPTVHLPLGHPNCAGPCAERAKPLIRPAERLCQVFMIEDGRLLEETALEAASWTPRLQCQNTCVQHVSRASPGFEASPIERNLDAIFDMLKVAARHRQTEVAVTPQGEEPLCRVVDQKAFNVVTVFDVEGYRAFIDRYSKVLPDHPEVMHNRVRVFVRTPYETEGVDDEADLDVGFLRQTLDELKSTFQKHATPPPVGGRGPPYTLIDVHSNCYHPEDNDNFDAFDRDVQADDYTRTRTGRVMLSADGEFYVDILEPEQLMEMDDDFGSDEGIEFGEDFGSDEERSVGGDSSDE